jgi:capsular polysaccharide biosynthesis protein
VTRGRSVEQFERSLDAPVGDDRVRQYVESPSRRTDMQLNDIGRRIFGEHSGIIVPLVVLGMLIALLLQVTSARTYTASTRLVLDTPDPKSRTEAMSISDTAKAIATSPALVRRALNDAKLSGTHAVDIAKNHVSVTGLGASGVVQLSVSDGNAAHAKAIANALAGEVIDTRLAFSRGQFQKVLPQLDERITALSDQIADLDGQIDSLSVQAVATSSAQAANSLRARRDDLVTTRDSLAQQRGELQSERISLLSANALRPNSSVISRATIPTHRDPGHWLIDVILGGLLGLIVGIGVAAALEAIRPTVVGSDNVAETLDTPLIGELPSVYPGEVASATEDLTPLKTRLVVAGEAAGSRLVGLVAADRSVDLWQLATHLDASPVQGGSAGMTVPEGLRSGQPEGRNGLRVRPVSLDDSHLKGRDGSAFVLVSPTSIKRTELLALGNLMRLSSTTLLGLITYKAPNTRHWPWLAAARDRVPTITPD